MASLYSFPPNIKMASGANAIKTTHIAKINISTATTLFSIFLNSFFSNVCYNHGIIELLIASVTIFINAPALYAIPYMAASAYPHIF